MSTQTKIAFVIVGILLFVSGLGTLTVDLAASSILILVGAVCLYLPYRSSRKLYIAEQEAIKKLPAPLPEDFHTWPQADQDWWWEQGKINRGE